MFCKKCGQEIPEGSKYCPFCGISLEENVNNKATFKDGIMALFNKLFIFDGKSSRSEFNYGLLFLMIISSIFSMFIMSTDLNALTTTDPTQMENSLNEMLNMFTSKNILDSYNLYNIGVSIVYTIFLSAPVFRRLADIGFDTKKAKVLTIVFVVSQLLCSTLLWCILPTNVYEIISIFLDVLSIVNLAILLMCVFKRGLMQK